MNNARATLDADKGTLSPLPGWVTSRRGEALEDMAFMSGAALSHLHLVVAHADVPQSLLRARLALRAAEASVAQSGRPERAADLRDAVHLLRPGDLPGPAGEIYQHWRQGVERPVSVTALHRALPTYSDTELKVWLGRPGAGQGGPVGRASSVLEAVMSDHPRAETVAPVLPSC